MSSAFEGQISIKIPELVVKHSQRAGLEPEVMKYDLLPVRFNILCLFMRILTHKCRKAWKKPKAFLELFR
jgi:hypothetical protein